MRKYILSMVATVGIFFVIPLYGQVTIGSLETPNKGALLDLKEDNVTTKGLLLPRVALDNLGQLKMSGYEIQDSDDGGGQYAKHIGLMVFNIRVNDLENPEKKEPADFTLKQKVCWGVHIWDGEMWVPLIPYNNSLYCVEPPSLPGDPGED